MSTRESGPVTPKALADVRCWMRPEDFDRIWDLGKRQSVVGKECPFYEDTPYGLVWLAGAKGVRPAAPVAVRA